MNEDINRPLHLPCGGYECPPEQIAATNDMVHRLNQCPQEFKFDALVSAILSVLMAADDPEVFFTELGAAVAHAIPAAQEAKAKFMAGRN